MTRQIILFVGILFIFPICKSQENNIFTSNLPQNIKRTWIGKAYWANPLQDWQLNRGRMECIVSGGERNVYLLTHEIDTIPGILSISVRTGLLNAERDSLDEGWIGFNIGVKGEFDDYRSSAVRGQGFPVGITTDGLLFIGKKNQKTQKIKTSFKNLFLELKTSKLADKYQIVLSIYDEKHRLIKEINRTDVQAEWIEGGLAIVCHNGKLKEFKDKRAPIEYPVWGTKSGIERGGNVRFWFSDWKVSGSKITVHNERSFGPILFAQHTLSKGILKMTAQMPPIGKEDGQFVELQTKTGNKWETIAKAGIDTLSRTATFKIENWNTKMDIPYRLAYKYYATNKPSEAYFEGTIRKEPLQKDELIVAAFTGNNDLGFPNNDIVESIKYHNPDFLFFSGDQIYEGVGGYGNQRIPLDKACIDYLRKWYLYGWAYRDLLRDRPVVALTDDHDMYHGNIWGAGGISTPEGLWGADAQDAGGYKMPAIWVNMVQRTQTSHLPDAYDTVLVGSGIATYYTSVDYGGISFAVIEDRKFKSAPKPIFPEAKIWNGWAQNKKWNVLENSNVPQAKLLGEAQLAFLNHWANNWTATTQMKVLLSQTIFANVATLPKKDAFSDAIVPKLRVMEQGDYPPDDVPVSDFDSNGWPQKGRNKALGIIRKAFAFHIAGDQHLGSFIQYGVDDWQDAGYAFCVPSISNVWPRRWYPAKEGKNRKPDLPKYTGDFKDGFGNKMTVSAVSNPIFTGKKPAKLYDRATGYGIIRLNKKTRDIIIECWPRQANPAKDKQYLGWPIKINQLDNYGRKALAYLPTINVKGLDNPLIQIIDEDNNEIVYTLRIKGNTYRPKVFKKGFYTIKIGETGTEKYKELNSIQSLSKDKLKNINVRFN